MCEVSPIHLGRGVSFTIVRSVEPNGLNKLFIYYLNTGKAAIR